MKQNNLACKFLTIILTLTVIGSLTANVQAQTSTDEHQAYEPKQKLNVDSNANLIMKEFNAGILALDQPATRLRIWANNTEEKRLTISISNENGIIWSQDFRDPYYNKVLDVSSLDDGIYTIRIIGRKNYFEKNITIMSRTTFTKGVSVE